MIYRHGLRVSEAIQMRRVQLDVKRSRLWVERLKGSLSVEQPVLGDELRAIKRYLATREVQEGRLPVASREVVDGALLAAVAGRGAVGKLLCLLTLQSSVDLFARRGLFRVIPWLIYREYPMAVRGILPPGQTYRQF